MRRSGTLFSILGCITLLAAAPLTAQGLGSYVALGDSLTAGVISASIGVAGQERSYPALLAAQMGVAPFEQPLVSDPGIPARLTLRSLSPLVIAPEPGTGAPINLFAPAYQNLGIPGATVNDLLDKVTDGGGPFDLVLRGAGTAVNQALAQSPEFVTLWIGNNDALGAATSGLVIEGVTLTPLADFERDYRDLAGRIDAAGARMALGTIPDVTVIPYVSTIPPVVVDPATNEPVLIDGLPIPLLGPDGPLELSDKVLLPASSMLAQGRGIPLELGGTGQPLPDEVLLSGEEVPTIQSRIEAFNDVIRSVAAEHGAALFDANRIFARIADRGFNIGGVEYDATLFGGIFSFDGVHPSPLGYAVAANELIRAINSQFLSSIPPVSYVPYISGQVGGIGSITLGTSRVRMTRRAQKNLRKILDVPRPRKLRRIKRRLEAGG